jgi:hypothetical protein
MIGTERDTRKRRRKARKERKEENMVALWSEATFLFYDVERISRVTNKEGVSVLTNQSRHLTSPSFVPAASSVYHAQCDIPGEDGGRVNCPVRMHSSEFGP